MRSIMKNKPFLQIVAVIVTCWGLLWVATAMAQQSPTIPGSGAAGSAPPANQTGKVESPPGSEVVGAEEPTSKWEDLDLKGLILEDNRWYHWLILAAAILLGWVT